MSENLINNPSVVFITANGGVERVELTEPWNALKQAGATVILAAPKVGIVKTMDHLDWSEQLEATVSTENLSGMQFDAVVLPGGVANPDQLRMDRPAVEFIRQSAAKGTPIASICHGAWTLVEAGSVKGRTMTSWPSLQSDIRNAGGTWIDSEVNVCNSGPGPIISSRMPDDIKAFNDAVIDTLNKQSS